MSEEYERTLLQLPSCHAFKIPARKSAEGHRAADWPQDSIFTGKLRIVSRGKLAIISLIDSENKIFASCPVTDESSVERTLDSGRYFVLKIQNQQGKHAYVGIAFNERNDAFDFNVALAEHKGENEREEKAFQEHNDFNQHQARDFSLKEGEKIKVKIGTGINKDKKNNTSSSTGGFLLAPPPGDSNNRFKGLLAPPPSSTNATNSDVFGSKNSSNTHNASTNLLDF